MIRYGISEESTGHVGFISEDLPQIQAMVEVMDNSVIVVVQWLPICAWDGCFPLNKLRGSHTCCRTCHAKYVLPELEQLRKEMSLAK